MPSSPFSNSNPGIRQYPAYAQDGSFNQGSPYDNFTPLSRLPDYSSAQQPIASTSKQQIDATPRSNEQVETPVYGSSYRSGAGNNRLTSTNSQEFQARSAPKPPVPFDPYAPHLPRAIDINFPGLYSSSGFDLLGVLGKVANRPNPRISIGPVDTSTSFVVVDARKFDMPIIYASETFSKLTGYHNMEIVGKNCRFLQAPGGQVERGSKRKHTDGKGVYHISQHVAEGKEVQTSIVNYRKDGSPFTNLITIIPVPGDTEEIAYFVGFQVGMVAQPHAILERIQSGSYIADSALLKHLSEKLPANSTPPTLNSPPVISPPSASVTRQWSSIDPPNPAVYPPKAVVDPLDTQEEDERRWGTLLLDNCGDLIFVLSLRGTFLYLSPSVERILEYEAADLISESISSICHPSDLAQLMRELKEAGLASRIAAQSTPGDSSSSADDTTIPRQYIHLLFRARRKRSGHTWMDAIGKVHIEPGKEKKHVVLMGRERPIYNVHRAYLNLTSNSLGDTEFWWKASQQGLCLYCTPSIEKVLGFKPEDVVGEKIIMLAYPDINGSSPPLVPNQIAQIEECLSKAARGEVASLRHYYRNKMGQPIDCFTNFYPIVSLAKPNMPQIVFIVCQTNEYQSEMRRRAKNEPTYRSDRASSTSTNAFTELDINKSTSWQYELHHLQAANKRLRAEIARLEEIKRNRLRDAQARQHAEPFSLLSSNPSSSAASSPMNKRDLCSNCEHNEAQGELLGPGDCASLCLPCALKWHEASAAAKTLPWAGGLFSSLRPHSPQPGSSMQVDGD